MVLVLVVLTQDHQIAPKHLQLQVPGLIVNYIRQMAWIQQQMLVCSGVEVATV